MSDQPMSKFTVGNIVDYHPVQGRPAVSRHAVRYIDRDMCWLTDKAGCIHQDWLTLVRRGSREENSAEIARLHEEHVLIYECETRLEVGL